MTATAPTAGVRSPADRWRSLPRWARAVLAAAAAVLGLNAGLAGLEAVTGGSGPAGPSSSSYATSAEGLAAFAQLVEDGGHPVERLRTRLDEARLDPATTLVLADVTEGTSAEIDAVTRFVEDGGRLVTAGLGAVELAGAITGDGPVAAGTPAGPARPLVPVPEVAGVQTVVSDGLGSFEADDTGATLPVLAGPGGVLAVVAVVGRGRMVAVADAGPWQNRLLDRADNAAFALGAVGEQGRPVAFAEAPHGYGAAKGLGAVPSEWKWGLAVGLLAVLTAMWSKGRRLGPPEELERVLPPPRRAYVDAVASTLVRTRQPAESMAPLQAAGLRRLARLGGLPDGAGADDLGPVAARAGLTDDDLLALLEPAVSHDRVMAAGRALARLEGADR